VRSVKNQPSYFADRLYKAMKVKVLCYVIHFPQHHSVSRRTYRKHLGQEHDISHLKVPMEKEITTEVSLISHLVILNRNEI